MIANFAVQKKIQKRFVSHTQTAKVHCTCSAGKITKRTVFSFIQTLFFIFLIVFFTEELLSRVSSEIVSNSSKSNCLSTETQFEKTEWTQWRLVRLPDLGRRVEG